jgi:nitrite reductase (NADH) small subunit
VAEIVAGKASDWDPGERRIVPYEKGEIGVFNVNGKFVAVRNYCPHHGAPVCLGALGGSFLPSRPQELEYGNDGEVLSCPWHHFLFDLPSGECLTNPRLRLKRFEVSVDDDRVIVHL